MIKILIVEDEVPISDLLKINLTNAGYQCTSAYDGIMASDYIQDNTYDLILLDIMLPKVDGYELLEYIKLQEIPVIFLTAKGSVEDRVKGLTLGAEDYIVKPFAILEVLARVSVVLRRHDKGKSRLSFDEFDIDMMNRLVYQNGKEITLRPKEFELFVFFVNNINLTLYRSQIYSQVWENEYFGDTRTLDLHIRRIRKKLELGERLKTVYRLGYRLESEQAT